MIHEKAERPRTFPLEYCSQLLCACGYVAYGYARSADSAEWKAIQVLEKHFAKERGA